MKRLRLSTLGLLGVIAYAGIIFTALRSSSPLWVDAIYTFTVGLLLVAVIAARFRRGAEGAFWFGFAVFGWGFLLLGRADPLPGEFILGAPAEKELLTSRLIRSLVPYLRAGTNELEQVSPITYGTSAIAGLVANLLISACGGLVAALIRRRRARPASAKVAAKILAGLALVAIPAWWGDFPPPPIALPPIEPAAGKFRPSLARREAWARHWTEFYRLLGEPRTLTPSGRETTVYRLIWEPSFHHRCCVRIWKEDGGRAGLKLVVMAGQGLSLAGGVAIRRESPLSDTAWDDLARRVEEARFWDQPTKETLASAMEDGDTLTVEGIRDGRQHRVTRRDPDPKFTELCRSMLEATGLQVKAIWDGYHSTDREPEMEQGPRDDRDAAQVDGAEQVI